MEKTANYMVRMQAIPENAKKAQPVLRLLLIHALECPSTNNYCPPFKITPLLGTQTWQEKLTPSSA